MIRNRNYKAT